MWDVSELGAIALYPNSYNTNISLNDEVKINIFLSSLILSKPCIEFLLVLPTNLKFSLKG